MMTLFGDGSADQIYLWTRLDGDYCWQDDSTGEKADGVFLLPGQALWVQCDAEDEDNPVPFKSSGQVVAEDISFELGTYGDAVICGNATPIEVDINDILCPADKTARDMVTVMTLFGDGSADQIYLWTRLDGEYCWQDDSTGEKADGITFQPGKGLWVQCDSEDEDNPIVMTIPGVEL